jgi:hypothetical protein
MIVDQAAINADLDLRRYAMKPRPAKLRIIIAQMEGSGTTRWHYASVAFSFFAPVVRWQ